MEETLIQFLNNYLSTNNTITTFLISSISFAILYDFLKLFFFKFLNWFYSRIKSSPKIFRERTKKNIIYLLKHYENELKTIKKIKNNDGNELLLILDRVYKYLKFILILLTFLFLSKILDNRIIFYAILGTSINLGFKIFYNLIYDYKLIQKARKYDKSKEKLDRKIIKLRQLIQSTKKENNKKIGKQIS